MWPLRAETSQGQSPCSSGNVLVRSTRVHLCDRRQEPGPGPRTVQITVQKLQDPLPVQSLSTRSENRQRPDKGAPVRAAAEPQLVAGRELLKNPEATKENTQPPDMKLCAGADSGQQPATDLLTSRFAAGGRGAVLASLKQRSHSAPNRREVEVQLLDPEPVQDDAGLRISPEDVPRQGTGSQRAAGVAGLTSGPDSTHAAAVAAAAAAAAAPLIKAQSDTEARVSQLMDGVEKLLQAHRVGGNSGQGLDQQALQHLELLHSQQLQLQSRLLESALQIVTSHTPLTSTSSELRATHKLDHLRVTDPAANTLSSKKQTSSATRAAFTTAMEMGTVAMETPQGNGWTEQTRQNCSKQDVPSVSKAAAHKREGDGQEVVRKASEVLREMGRLKGEIKALLKPEDSVRTTAPPPENPFLSQQNYSHLNQNQSQPVGIQPQLSQYHHTHSQAGLLQSSQNQAHSRKVQSHQSLFHKIQAPSQSSQSVPVQKRPVVPTMLEEAGQVLRQVRRQRKVLEENLEALLRAKSGEVLHCQLDALAANRDWTNEVRIKKTVDAWINTRSSDMQTETSRVAVTSQQGAAESSAHSVRRRPVSGTGRKVGRGGRAQTVGRKAEVQGAEHDRVTGVLDGESYLTRLYGRAPYEGLRRTLKKSPYLRFSSPASLLGSKPRPRLVESVQGVKVKSCKTQTCLATAPVERQRCTFSSAHMASSDPTEAEPVPMAVPLGRPRVESSSRCRLGERQREATPPHRAPPSADVVAMDDDAPEQQSQNQSDTDEARPSHNVYIIERKSEEEDEEDSDFLSVTDVQEEVGADAVELEGGPPPPPGRYQGPLFPPPPSALPAPGAEPILGLDQGRGVLENRLVEWVEQQLMSRMISDMYRTSSPTQNVSSEERSVTSDIVEAAGGAGLQLFVDSNIEVDSALIRQLVSEVLTETASLLLGQRDSLDTDPELVPPKLEPAAAQEEKLVLLVPTPVPTPPPSPIPYGREATPLATPPSSEPIGQLHEESPQPVTACEPMATPTFSPEPAPSAALILSPPPLTWGGAELPLDEVQPEAPLESHSPPLLMSVAEEEPPVSSPPPPSALAAPSSSPPSPPSLPDPRPASSSSEDSSSSSSSSSAVTEAALRHISEGELLLSVKLRAALTEDEAACSFSSSLPDMDIDPPSEGQVRGQDLLLQTKTEQRLSHQGERPQPEGSWGREEEVSVGEVRDNWTTEPSRTTNPSKSTSAQQDRTSSSPGQISQCAEVSFEATNQGPVSMGDLMMEPLATMTSDLQTELSPPPPYPENTLTAAQVVSIQVKQIVRQTAELDLQSVGTRKMDVHLPLIRTDQEEEMEESVSSAETDSSTNHVF